MKIQSLSAAILALQGASFVFGGPIKARDDKLETPSKEEIQEEIEQVVGIGYEYVFYVGKAKDDAKTWAAGREDICPAVTLWGTTDKYDDMHRVLYEDPDEMQKQWVRVFTENAEGTAWVMYESGDPIPHNLQSWYNTIERKILEKKTRDDDDPLEEVIQINRYNQKEIYQIFPVDVRDFTDKDCKWYGSAPDCNAQCPDETKMEAKSQYGDSSTDRCEGSGRKVFCCKD